MKKVLTILFALLLSATFVLAQNTGGDKQQLNPQPLPPRKTPHTTHTKSAAHKGTSHHKGGKAKKGGATNMNGPTK